jgi:hypothetical protein
MPGTILLDEPSKSTSGEDDRFQRVLQRNAESTCTVHTTPLALESLKGIGWTFGQVIRLILSKRRE